ncbi:tetratricopeptide repeat protein [Roseovarius spongiae]|uniref:Tetratricopeptide repeat protein n=1 Tax=Roseovarius spongiae TaxID=2320272 RepID=A0A3A8B934_9RHOB|nr:tetratricopeptide repeat protein [Roseovarius spongiae]RKF14625.1 tetratricopeptide repeat protein [Roseovarius spongiae]
MRVILRPLTALALGAALLLPPATTQADESVGAYLAARQARFNSDYEAAALYLTRAMAEDPANPEIMEYAIAAQVSLGKIDRALPIARQMEEQGFGSQIARMVLLADEVKREEYGAVLARIEAENGVGPLADGLIAAWATLGEGDMATALTLFDKIAEEAGLRSFAIYHKALALASVGDYESADAIYAGKSDGPMQTTRRGTIAWAEVLSQLERNEDAIKVIDEAFGSDLDPQIADLRARLESGERISFGRVGTPREGIAEVFYSLGRALLADTGEDYVLLYSRIAEYLDENHIDARIMTAELLENIGQYDLATEAYKRVPPDNPAFHVAELGRAETLRRAGRLDAAAEVLEQLRRSHPDLAIAHASAGDLYRQREQFDKAIAAYDQAVDLYKARDNEQWFVYYARAISHERRDHWNKAEADFRQALELNPDQPQVLNYLGYSLVEQHAKLDEALEMIERAVELNPGSGYIVDSLGWALYRLGRYEEAIGHMERAAELMPVDPVVNDHLGDVLWAVGRQTEARFQWKRALSFVDKENPSPDVKPERIRRKLEVGLDQVLREEGAPPLELANDKG